MIFAFPVCLLFLNFYPGPYPYLTVVFDEGEWLKDLFEENEFSLVDRFESRCRTGELSKV